jgi:hypothetical protein
MDPQTVVQFPDFAIVPKHRVPVIIYDNFEQAQKIAAVAINLLRFGHPAVQVIVNQPEGLIEVYSGAMEVMRKALSDAVEALSIYIDEALDIKENEIFGVRPPDEADFQGQYGNKNCVFLVYKA